MTTKLICVEGNIGVGKTTFVERFAEKTGAVPIYESFIENPFLPAFYKNPELKAFPLEMSFLIERFNQLNDFFTNPIYAESIFVADYHFIKTLLFAEINLKEAELKIFKHYHQLLNHQLPKPDFTIFLTANLHQIKENIKNRDRVFERNISQKYLEEIQKNYKKHFSRIKKNEFIMVDYTEKMWPKTDQIIDNVKSRIL